MRYLSDDKTEKMNSSNETSPHREYPFKIVEMVFIILPLSVLSLVTIIGNVLVMLSIKVNKNLQTVNNYFLFSLACADVIIGLFSMNFYTVFIVARHWPLGPVICDLWLALDYVASNASVMNLLVISFDRYFCVTRPLSYPVKRTTKMAGVMIAAAWILSFVLWAPAILFWQFIVGERTVPDGECSIQFFSNAGVTFGTAIAAFYLPVGIMSVLYWQISRASRSRVGRESRSAPRFCQENWTQVISPTSGGRGTTLSQGAADMTQDQHRGSDATAGEDRESENDSTSGTLASSNQRDDEAETNGDVKSTPTKTSCQGKARWAKITCFQKSPDENYKPASTNQSTSHCKDSLVPLKLLPAHRKKRKTQSRERKVTRTIMAILLAFIITWTPYNVMVLITTFCSDCVPTDIWKFGYWMCYINSTVNPACYALCNVTFKSTFKRLLMCNYRNIRTVK
ncbi:muscarinic acetylcholine receptor M2 [Brachyhypopomus gauderio]|uniref:muscarinic acetylcholine receptor M2 n=1 Tax=Brachyhypopomus gauderio TaxID=698409 RepID=UPI004042031C